MFRIEAKDARDRDANLFFPSSHPSVDPRMFDLFVLPAPVSDIYPFHLHFNYTPKTLNLPARNYFKESLQMHKSLSALHFLFSLTS